MLFILNVSNLQPPKTITKNLNLFSMNINGAGTKTSYPQYQFEKSVLKALMLFLLAILISNCTSQNRQAGISDTFKEYKNEIATPRWYNNKPDTLSVVTWNIEHFVDAYDNPYTDNSREDNPPVNMEERRRLLTDAIRSLDADVVVFQELESDSYLQVISEEYFPEMGYRVFAALESPDWYMNVVMMSRIPVGIFYSYAHAETPIIGQTDEDGNPSSQSFTNNRMWTADLLVNDDYGITLTGLHLKAGRGERNEAWRLGQIELLRSHLKLLSKINPERNMLITGDLNTTPGSREFNRLLGKNPPVFIDPLEGTGSFSHPSDSLFWRIDHILPNQNLAREMVQGSTKVIEPLDRESMILISDHLPLISRFVTRDL